MPKGSRGKSGGQRKLSNKPYRHGDAKYALGKGIAAGKRKPPPPAKASAPAPVEESEEEGEEEEEELEEEQEIEEEWGGIPDQEDEEEEASTPEPLPPIVRRVKKGKKFMESTSALLELIGEITGEKEVKEAIKLTKVKRPPPLSVQVKQKEDKLQAKKDQFESAKSIISAQTRAKKDRRIAREVTKRATTATSADTAKNEGEGEEGDQGGRKRVSFA